MTSPTLAILPLFWAIWTFVGVLTTFTMTIIQGHYQTGIISISDTGEYYPESIVLAIVSTVSTLLEAGIVYIVYKSMEIQALKRSFCRVTCQTWMLTFGWMMCIGNLITPFLQDSPMLNNSCLAVLSSTIIYGGISVATQLYPGSRDRKCRRITTTVLAVIILLANISRLSFKMSAVYTCTSDYCTQVLTTTTKRNMIDAKSILRIDPLTVPLLDGALEDQQHHLTPDEASCDYVTVELFSADDTAP
ncbi:DNA damage-regulated autophagy modulator protein 1-like isoform X2 [Hyla sarda]|uniref:DNA damage-regulated autophagy modulator protein 1-like isoform X2 n=1 Tax=Hyla sarda TaxID=327740 RepID=UPI0024C42377|nr:DNA damage-regulated autophagy modulator protein 1-like isoform X2 [Hyla sarda]